jgi:hypothetical protein
MERIGKEALTAYLKVLVFWNFSVGAEVNHDIPQDRQSVSQILTSRGATHCTAVFGIRIDVLSVYVCYTYILTWYVMLRLI